MLDNNNRVIEKGSYKNGFKIEKWSYDKRTKKSLQVVYSIIDTNNFKLSVPENHTVNSRINAPVSLSLFLSGDTGYFFVIFYPVESLEISKDKYVKIGYDSIQKKKKLFMNTFDCIEMTTKTL